MKKEFLYYPLTDPADKDLLLKLDNVHPHLRELTLMEAETALEYLDD
jgi:hypothetical protein